MVFHHNTATFGPRPLGCCSRCPWWLSTFVAHVQPNPKPRRRLTWGPGSPTPDWAKIGADQCSISRPEQFDIVYSLQLVHSLGGHWTETLFLPLFQKVNCPPSWMSTQPDRTPVNLVRRYWCYFCTAGPDLPSLCMDPRRPLGF